jgi:hypothetical protein
VFLVLRDYQGGDDKAARLWRVSEEYPTAAASVKPSKRNVFADAGNRM